MVLVVRPLVEEVVEAVLLMLLLRGEGRMSLLEEVVVSFLLRAEGVAGTW